MQQCNRHLCNKQKLQLGNFSAHGRRSLVLHAPSITGITLPRSIQCNSQQPNKQSAPILENDRVLAAITSIGLNGSAAAIGAQLAGVNLWNQFHWDRIQDFRLTFLIGIGVIGLDYFLLGIPWWKGLKTDTSLANDTQSERTHSSTQPSKIDRSIDAVFSGAVGQSNAANAGSCDDTRGESNVRLATAEQPENDSSGNSIKSSQSKLSPTPFNLHISPALLISQGDQQPSFELLRATLALQQACYIATATLMRAEVPPALDALLITLRETAKELLQRGLFVTFLAAWLADRCFEAGAEDVVQLAGQEVLTSEACRYAIAGLVTLLLLPPVIRDAQALSLSVATNWAIMASKADGDQDELVQEYRLYEALEKTVFALPARISWGLHTARGVLRFATINAAFAITNNLAASLTLSVLSNLFILAYNQQGRKDLGLRSNATGVAQDGNRRPSSLKWPPDSKQDKDKQ